MWLFDHDKRATTGTPKSNCPSGWPSSPIPVWCERGHSIRRQSDRIHCLVCSLSAKMLKWTHKLQSPLSIAQSSCRSVPSVLLYPFFLPAPVLSWYHPWLMHLFYRKSLSAYYVLYSIMVWEEDNCKWSEEARAGFHGHECSIEYTLILFIIISMRMEGVREEGTHKLWDVSTPCLGSISGIEWLIYEYASYLLDLRTTGLLCAWQKVSLEVLTVEGLSGRNQGSCKIQI